MHVCHMAWDGMAGAGGEGEREGEGERRKRSVRGGEGRERSCRMHVERFVLIDKTSISRVYAHTSLWM